MKSFKSFASETVVPKKTDSNELRIKSLTTQKTHIDDVLKQTRKRQQLNKAYQTISKLNSPIVDKKKPIKNEKK